MHFLFNFKIESLFTTAKKTDKAGPGRMMSSVHLVSDNIWTVVRQASMKGGMGLRSSVVGDADKPNLAFGLHFGGAGNKVVPVETDLPAAASKYAVRDT
jgi:hypothetical protein